MKLTVLMPVHHAEATLRQALDSILSQSFTDFELMIIDDGSNQETKKILSLYQAQDPRVKIQVNPEALGVVKSLNIGLKLAKGELVARMDSDDISLPDRFKLQVEYLNLHPEIAILGGDVFLLGNTLKNDFPNPFPHDPVRVQERMLSDNCLCHPAVMFRKDIVLSLGGYDEFFKNAEDYDLWLRALYEGFKIANLPGYVLRYRLSLGGATIGKRWEQYCYYRMAQVRFVTKYKEKNLNLMFEGIKNKYAAIEEDFIAESLLSSSEQLMKLRLFKSASVLLKRCYPFLKVKFLKSWAQTFYCGFFKKKSIRQIERFYTPYS